MTDTRFTTAFEYVWELLDRVDIDDVDDLETLLMFLLDRPVSVEVVGGDGGPDPLEVIVHGNGEDERVTSWLEFPMSVVDLARSCAEDAAQLGPYLVHGKPTSPVDVEALDDEELAVALRHALGKVRISNLLDAQTVSE